MQIWQLIAILFVNLSSSAIIILLLLRNSKAVIKSKSESISEISLLLSEFEERINHGVNMVDNNSSKNINDLRTGLNETFGIRLDAISKQLCDRQLATENAINIRLDAQQKLVNDQLDSVRKSFDASIAQNESRYQSFESNCFAQMKLIDTSLETGLRQMRESNDKKLDEIRGVVDEKLQRTLNERFNENFKLINERLAEVHKGLGEMQNLAAGVGDLKRVLSNVKTRGNLGELQLSAILEEILSPEQYERNFDAKKQNSTERVEFAIKMPSDTDDAVYLPIDSKFPADVYSALVDAYDSADPDSVASARKTLTDTLKGCAKSIRDKYINPPRTTDFAVMFLPTEGLYAEAVRLGLIEKLQHDYRINIAGPSTMVVLLNSLRMGFQTVAIQKRSGEVWKILASIKKEFRTFNEILEKTQKNLNTANSELDKMIGVRTRAILRTLKDVETIDAESSDASMPMLTSE